VSLRPLLLALALPLLAGCENSATSYKVDSGHHHALVLVREQPYFWRQSVNQFIVVSRLPGCQRKVAIHPDSTTMTPIELYEAGDLLWALRQGERWYLASTERCLVQDWPNPSGEPPGPAVGRFQGAPGGAEFVPAGV